jgi:type I restriction enzyme R subunit
MPPKEAHARIKINKLLEEAGWRFFDTGGKKANILLENNTRITVKDVDEWGEDFEKTKTGFMDFLLLDDKGFPFIVLEAKAESRNPLVGKEQARKYARSQNCRFIILSNGSMHYLWDLERGNPQAIIVFPSPESVAGYARFKPNPERLINELVEPDYIVMGQKPDYRNDPAWQNEETRPEFNRRNHLAFLRPYQLNAVKSIQSAVRNGSDRFLFEMATGTGKTTVAAAILRLFLRTYNAQRILFLVDRLELEEQACRDLIRLLKNDYKVLIYKHSKDDWRKAEIVVSTIQTFLFNNRYKRNFAPDDFDMVISDEAHRSIGGNSRAVFEYFIGYKLGLTATPKAYLKHIDVSALGSNDPRELERRILLDTYNTFGCETGEPTFRYSLLDGVKEGYLVNPVVVDARTDVTTQLLSEQGYVVNEPNENGEAAEDSFVQRDFEKSFFSENTNRVFCQTFLDNGFKDPITGEFGKSLIFCVSQNHAAKIVQLLNEMADNRYPGKYNSDFAIQITSQISDAKQFTLSFKNNNLSGNCNFNLLYKTCKTRACVTVGMMTTGYDCPDILNLGLIRPVYSPTDFIQIKGRGTRKHNFTDDLNDPQSKILLGARPKENFKLFDFFANCEYFENDFNYDQVLVLPRINAGGPVGPPPPPTIDIFENKKEDYITSLRNQLIGVEGMKIDRMYYDKFEEKVKAIPALVEKLERGEWEEVLTHIEQNILDKPQEFFTMEKLRQAAQVDRRISLREMVEKILGMIPFFKSKNELLDEEFDKFDSRYLPKEEYFNYAKTVFKAYILDLEFRKTIDTGKYADLNISPFGEAFHKLSPELRKAIPEYIKDFVPLNKFAA